MDLMRVSTHKSNVKQLEHPKPSATRQIGFGLAPDQAKIKAGGKEGLGAAGAFIDWVKDSVNCPIFNMPVIEQVRWGMNGPQTDASLKANFGAEIDLFGSGRDAIGVDYVESTMRQPGETQTYMLACAIFFHVEPEPMCWTAFGNAWQTPAGGVTSGNIPISPDVFTNNDLVNGAIAATTNPISGASPTASYGPAVLEWGWWANYAAWHLVRGYNMRWMIGQHTNIMDEVLRHTAYMPTNAQEGSASNSEVDIVNAVNRVNSRYASLGASLQFLKVNRIRIGSYGVGGANYGIFRPSNDDELVGATYGGMDLRSLLRGNSEFRKLTVPYMIRPGIPIGLFAQANDDDQISDMQAYLALSQNGGNWGGAFPQQVTDTGNSGAGSIAAGQLDGTGANNVALERTLDGSNVPQQMAAGRYVYKGGTLKLSQGVKGFEVNEDWYTILQNNPELRDAVMCECGFKMASLGSAG